MPRRCRTGRRRARRLLVEQLEARLCLDVTAPPILQYFEGSYATIENRTADIFNAGYGGLYLPPPGRADSGNQSVGYDVYNRFDLGSPGNPTLYGTETGLKTLVNAIHQAGNSVYIDLVWNHDGFEDQNTPGFAAAGGYPGFALTLSPSTNYASYNDPNGDFHDPSDNSTTGMRLAGLIDIAQEKNYQFIRSPVDPNNPQNIPAGTTPYNGRLANVPDPNNARFYPDTSLQPIIVYDPTTGEQNIKIYPFNNADPLHGTPVAENSLGYLMRYAQWMVQYMGVDGFRVDAAKNMPTWVLNYLDRAVYRSSFRTNLDGSQENIFSFSEVFDGDKSFLQQFVRKDINPANPGTIGGNRDVLDFPLYFAMDSNLTNNGFQNDWNNVVNASQDSQDDGLANNGSEGVAFVSNQDVSPPYLDNVAYAYALMRPGNVLVYFNAHEFGTGRNFPKDGRGDALGGYYGDTITNLVNIRDTHPDGNYIQRDLEKEILIFERDDSALVALSNRLDSGYDSRTVQTDFAPGTPLIELTGNASDTTLDPDGAILPLLVVNPDGTVNLRVPRNRNDNNVETDKGYVIYAPSGPQGQPKVNGVDHVIPGETPTQDTNGTARLSSIDMITGNSFQIELDTNAVNLLGSFRDHPADGDNALFKIDNGVDVTGGDFVSTNPGDVAYGFQQFTTVHNPGYFSSDGNGQYVQAIDVSKLSEGMHYITVRAFRHRNAGDPPIFTDFRIAIYIDRTPTVSTIVSFNPLVAGVNENRQLLVRSTDLEANNVHVFFDLPAALTDAQILAMVGSANQATQIDRDLWTMNDNGVTSGNHVATVVSYEISGNVNVQRFRGLFTSTIFGAGLGDLNFDGKYDVSDVQQFGHVLASNNNQFNPAADLNGDGVVDNRDLLLLYQRLLVVGADPSTLAAYNQILGPTTGGYTITEGGSLTLNVDQPSGTTPTLTFGWDVNNHDPNFGDASGAGAILSWAQLGSLGIHGPGTYPIAVRINDDTESIDLTTTLTVQDAPIHVTQLNPPPSPVEGIDTGLLNLATFTDDYLSASAADYTVIVAWGDGHSDTLTAANGGIVDDGTINGERTFSVVAAHTYTEEAANLSFKVTVSDVGGASDSASGSVSVADTAVHVTQLNPPSPMEGISTGLLTLATFTDDNPSASAGDYTATVAWGDGQSDTLTAANGSVVDGGTVNGKRAFSVVAAHTYAEEAASLPFTVTVSDIGSASDSVSGSVSVADAALQADGLNFQGFEGLATPVLSVAAFTDQGGPETPGDYGATIDWGDGNPVQPDVTAGTVIGPDAGGAFHIQGSHLYAEVRSYPIHVAITHAGAPAADAYGTAHITDSYGILLLDPARAGALSVMGTGILSVSGGGVLINSPSAGAVKVSGKAALSAAELDVAGTPGVRTTGKGQVSGVVNVGESATPDPLASLSVPTASATFTVARYAGTSTVTLQPGTYVGGIHLSGQASVTLLPGVYVLKGGGLSVSGQASLTGAGVLVYNAPAGPRDAITITGRSQVFLSAPAGGTFGGVALWQDRASKVPVTIDGTASVRITGTLYAAGAAVSVAGHSELALSGNPTSGTIGALIAADLTVAGAGRIDANPNGPALAGASTARSAPGSVTPILGNSEPRTQRVFERSKRHALPLTPLRFVRGSDSD
jgi:glycosidase